MTLLTAGATLVAPIMTTSLVQIAAADDCPDAEIIFARGTSEPPGVGRVGEAFIDAVRAQTPGTNVAVYAVNYNASRLQIHGGDGANDTINRVKDMAGRCPATKLVLGGYSQGASVIDIVAGVPIGGIGFGAPLPPEYVDNIAAVATFGNVADRAGSPISAQSALLGSKAIDMCNPGDPICHAGPGNEWGDHTDGYIPSYTNQAAAFVAPRIAVGQAHLPAPVPPGN